MTDERYLDEQIELYNSLKKGEITAEAARLARNLCDDILYLERINKEKDNA